MGQNLNTGTRIDDSIIQTNNGIIEKHCYNNLESNCDVYGGLYQWNEMMQVDLLHFRVAYDTMMVLSSLLPTKPTSGRRRYPSRADRKRQG